MCGFVGGTDPAWDYAAALRKIAHRGPDASSLRLDGPVQVGFCRLSIIDLHEAANQPMLAENGSTWIVFNGEIYGFKRLRQVLEDKGRRFRTTSDTEVVLNAYLEWGDDFVDRIDGMFAMAIWDNDTRELKLYRDRPGIKPLFYFYDGRRFAFASELKAIEAALASESLETDGSALYDFLGYRYVPAPKTLYRHCFKLEPAHRLVLDLDRGTLRGPSPYWRLPVVDEPSRLPIGEACERLRGLIDDSVRDQMVADVPVGFFLSGGVDSSTVVASAARVGGHISTYTIGFDAEEVSETAYAREVASLVGADHHERILLPDEAQELLPSLKAWFDEPFADESALPTFLVCEAARADVKVVLTGDGGDEVFGGYRTYPRFERYDRWPTWPRFMDDVCVRLRKPLRRRNAVARLLALLETGFSKGPELWAKLMLGMPRAAKTHYRRAFDLPKDYDDWWHYRQFWRDDLPLRTRLQYVDFHTFLPGLVLAKVDRTSMAVSLEARVPLLAREIIEFSFSLHEDTRYFNGELKGLLREAYRGVIPDRLLDRRKKGFGIPRYYLRDLSSRVPIQQHILERLFLQTA